MTHRARPASRSPFRSAPVTFLAAALTAALCAAGSVIAYDKTAVPVTLHTLAPDSLNLDWTITPSGSRCVYTASAKSLATPKLVLSRAVVLNTPVLLNIASDAASLRLTTPGAEKVEIPLSNTKTDWVLLTADDAAPHFTANNTPNAAADAAWMKCLALARSDLTVEFVGATFASFTVKFGKDAVFPKELPAAATQNAAAVAAGPQPAATAPSAAPSDFTSLNLKRDKTARELLDRAAGLAAAIACSKCSGAGFTTHDKVVSTQRLGENSSRVVTKKVEVQCPDCHGEKYSSEKFHTVIPLFIDALARTNPDDKAYPKSMEAVTTMLTKLCELHPHAFRYSDLYVWYSPVNGIIRGKPYMQVGELKSVGDEKVPLADRIIRIAFDDHHLAYRSIQIRNPVMCKSLVGSKVVFGGLVADKTQMETILQYGFVIDSPN